jgi:hypothetical protein
MIVKMFSKKYWLSEISDHLYTSNMMASCIQNRLQQYIRWYLLDMYWLVDTESSFMIKYEGWLVYGV